MEWIESMNNEKIIYTKPISLYRIIVNSTFNTVCFILLIIFSFQYFYMIALWLETLLFQLVILVTMIAFTVTEYKKSFFLVTKEKVTFFRPSSLKKKLDLEFKDILGISVESSNVVVYDKNKNRYPLLYISNPKEVCKDLNKLLELGEKGNKELIKAQRKALGEIADEILGVEYGDEVVIATNNAHKLEEIGDILNDLDYKIYSLKDVDLGGIEIVEDGKTILSNVIATQIPFHQEYKGVVPEIASRCHTEVINGIIRIINNFILKRKECRKNALFLRSLFFRKKNR